MKRLIILQDEQGNVTNTWLTYRAAALDLGVTAQLVNYICNGKVKHSYKVKGKLTMVWITDEEAAELKAKGIV